MKNNFMIIMSAYTFVLSKHALSSTRAHHAKGLSPLLPYGRRTMAINKGKKEFLCILPDRPNVLEIRKQVKAIHYEGIKPLVESGQLVAGGAMLETHPVESNDVPFKGSMIVFRGEGVEDVRGAVRNDIYAKSGVWDLEKAQIIPYVSAVREPMS